VASTFSEPVKLLNTDDVIVDGKIITGEDDPSAREMGRRLATVLAQ